jgi:catechol 2,3-dioxygenase-like lactoylglutathione lyase family enzyme
MTSITEHMSLSDEGAVRNPNGPGLLGLSHLGITVRTVPAALRFWTSVMGFTTLVDGDDFCMIFEPSSKLAIGLSNQQGQAEGSFDERRVGLDHLGLAVADVATLLRWEQRLTDLDVPHSPIATSDAGHHLNLRAPDNFPIELFVLSVEGATSLGGTTPPSKGSDHDPVHHDREASSPLVRNASNADFRARGWGQGLRRIRSGVCG